MADNVTIPTTGTGTATPVIRTDDVAGAQYQIIKLDLGGDGVSQAVTVNAGNADAGTQRVVLASDQASVTVDVGAESAGLALAANQLADGHNVTVDNAAGAAAVNIQDGGNIITVDGTVTANAGTGTMTVDLGSNNDVQGAVAEGAAVGQNPFLIAGDDGTNVRHVAVDTLGNVQVDIVDDGAGLATAANQLPDGHNVTVDNASLTVDLTTNNDVQGAVAELSPVGSNPFLIAGDDGTNVRHVAVDTLGNVQVDIVADAAGLATAANQLPDGHNVTVDNASIATTNAIVDGWDNAASDGASVTGDVAHDTADAGEPVKVGHQAAEFGAAPPEVAADARRVNSLATIHGIPFTLGGFPNLVSRVYRATTAQTDDDMLETVGATNHLVVTRIAVVADNANSADIGVRIGFGATTVPAEPADGASDAGLVLSHPGIAAGSGVSLGDGSGIVAVGAAGEELRITTDASQAVKVMVGYFISTL